MRRGSVQGRALLSISVLVMMLTPGTAGASHPDAVISPIEVHTGDGDFYTKDANNRGLYWASQTSGTRAVTFALHSTTCSGTSPTGVVEQCALNVYGLLGAVNGVGPVCENFSGSGTGVLEFVDHEFDITQFTWDSVVGPNTEMPWPGAGQVRYTIAVRGTYIRSGLPNPLARPFDGVVSLHGGYNPEDCNAPYGTDGGFVMVAELVFR